VADEDRYHSPFCRCYECWPADVDVVVDELGQVVPLPVGQIKPPEGDDLEWAIREGYITSFTQVKEDK
jgi:hypothetical protein